MTYMEGRPLALPVPTRVALLFAYDGPCFDGYSRQGDPVLHTVEDALMRALVEAGVAGDMEALGWRTGSRTDRGVSARENVVAFWSDTPTARVCRALGGRIDGVWPLAAAEVEEGFDPRRALWREYRYFLAGRWSRGALRRLEEALGLFVGEHDFSAFCRTEAGRDPRRRVDSVAVATGADGAVVSIQGGSFLRQQVRRMIAAARAVVEGRLTAEAVTARLASGGPSLDLMPAAPEPLVLWAVHDPRVRFIRALDAAMRLEEKRRAARSAAWARAELYRSLDREA